MKKLFTLALLLLASPAWADRQFMSGCETNDLTKATEFSSVTASPSIVTSSPTPHGGTYACQISASAASEQIESRVTPNITTGTIYFRGYFNATTWPATDNAIIQFRNSSATVLWEIRSIDVSGARRLRVRSVTSSTQSDCSDDLSTGTWYRMEIKVVIADAGSIQLKTYSGDEPTTTLCDITHNADTLTTNWRSFNLGSNASTTQTITWDDMGVNEDDAGSQSSWLGPGKIEMVKPASNDTVNWTKTGANCSGTTNTDCVDDEPGIPDDDSGYNTLSASACNSVSDRFNSTTLSGPDSDDIINVWQLWMRSGGTSATSTNTGRLKAWDDGGSLTDGTTNAVFDINGYIALTTAMPPTWTIQLYPAALGDKKAQVEAYDMGYEGVSVAQSCKVTALWANVEWTAYTPASCTAGLNLPLLGVGGCP